MVADHLRRSPSDPATGSCAPGWVSTRSPVSAGARPGSSRPPGARPLSVEQALFLHISQLVVERDTETMELVVEEFDRQIAKIELPH